MSTPAVEQERGNVPCAIPHSKHAISHRWRLEEGPWDNLEPFRRGGIAFALVRAHNGGPVSSPDLAHRCPGSLPSLRTALRSLHRRWRTTLLSVGGLALGVGVCVLASLYVWTQLSYDRHHEDAERIYRLHEAGAAYTYDEVWFDLANDFPGDAAAAVLVPRAGVVSSDAAGRRGDGSTARVSALRTDHLYYASSSVFDVFTYPLARGTAATAFDDPASIVISHAAAQAHFPDQNPIGQTLVVPGEEAPRTLTVTGVLASLPQALHVRPDYLVPLENLRRENGRFAVWMYVYVQTRGRTTITDVTGWLSERRERRNATEENRSWLSGPLRAQPLTDIYLASDLQEEIAPTGSAVYLWAFGIVGVLVLLIACINYVNLTTAQVGERGRTAGLRKTFGASRAQVAAHFLAESTLVTVFSVIAGVGLAALAVPFFNRSTPDPVAFDQLWTPGGLCILLVLTLGTAFLASAYPAAYLSGLRPIRLFRGQDGGPGQARLQRGLVVTQFAVSIALTAVTIVVVQQTRYLAEKDLGLDREHTLMVNTWFAGTGGPYGLLPTPERERRLHQIEARLRQRTDVRATGRMAYRPNSDYVFNRSLQSPDPDGPSVEARLMFGTEGVSRAMGVPMVAGQRLDEAPEGILINRAAAEALGDAGQVGAPIRLRIGMGGDTTSVIAGIMENFHYQSLRSTITPAFLFAADSWRSDDYLFVRARPGEVDAVLGAVREAWTETMPPGTFDYTFLDDEFAQMHRADRQQRTLLLVLAGVTLFVACLGLVGLVAYRTDRRRAEIGVRKTLGASTASIIGLFTKDVLRWVGVAFVLAVPVAYGAATTWLAPFAYRIDVGPMVFGGAGLVVALLAVGVIVSQVGRAAQIDPATAIRGE